MFLYAPAPSKIIEKTNMAKMQKTINVAAPLTLSPRTDFTGTSNASCTRNPTGLAYATAFH